MKVLVNSADTATLSYWLDWRVFFCGTMVIFFMFVALFLLWKYEWSATVKKMDIWEEKSWSFLFDEAWRPCVKEVNPMCLMAFRLVSFSLLVAALACHVVVYGGSLFYYYTQWTFTLVTIYFGFGSLLSIYGCYHHSKSMDKFIDQDGKQGLEEMLLTGTGSHGDDAVKSLDFQKPDIFPERAGLCGYVFQVLFQMGGGAVVLTDIVYWFVIFPTLNDYDLTFLTVVAHSLNMLLLADAALNCLPFPWFRIAYFIFWTGAYVLSQWIVHACESIWWPYPFLDLSSPNAPLWYFVVALMHIPCYGSVVLLVELKKWAFSKNRYDVFSDENDIISSC